MKPHLDLADRINGARNFVECGSLAVEGSQIDRADSSAICAVLDEAIDRLREIAAEVVARGNAAPESGRSRCA